MHIEPETPNRQNNLEKWEQRWRHHTFDSNIYYKAIISKTYGTGITHRHGPMGQNQEPKNLLTHIWSTDIWQGWQEYKIGNM